LNELEKIEGISSLSAQNGGSVKPIGDVIRMTVSNAGLSFKDTYLADH
jgi:hypothetical protein